MIEAKKFLRRAQAEDKDEGVSAVDMVRDILSEAVRQRASDIHFEPDSEGIRIRFRIDGRLTEMMRCEHAVCAPLVVRLKILGGMDISEKRKPQDGRATIGIDGTAYDVRFSSMPTIHGEKLALRLMQKEYLFRDKRELGMEGEELLRFGNMLSRPHGLILVVGPTGSGKSTTMYTALGELNREDVNIVTVEDPVEAHLRGVNQIQVNPKAGLTFASVLRAVLRQDPDIIMVGEIRDKETAEAAIQAAITGHLVFSTLHTNSAAAAFVRLSHMGVEPYLIADAVIGVVSQRLVRRLCSCRTSREATEQERREFDMPAGEPLLLGEPCGCEHCRNSGYFGRIGVFEVMPVTEDIRRAILHGAPSSRIEGIAAAEGMSLLREKAARLVCSGVTSVEEYKRIFGENERTEAKRQLRII